MLVMSVSPLGPLRVRWVRRALFVNHPVADTPFREYVFGLRWILLDLLAQVSHVELEVVNLVAVLRPPHLDQAVAMRQDAPGIPHEASQQLEFGWCEVYAFATDFDDAPVGVQLDVAYRVDTRALGRAGGLGAAQNGFHPGEQLARVEGFY